MFPLKKKQKTKKLETLAISFFFSDNGHVSLILFCVWLRLWTVTKRQFTDINMHYSWFANITYRTFVYRYQKSRGCDTIHFFSLVGETHQNTSFYWKMRRVSNPSQLSPPSLIVQCLLSIQCLSLCFGHFISTLR